MKRSYRKKANQLSQVRAAYVAGIIDGEGHISARLHRGSVYGVLEVGNVHRELLDDLCAETGVGSVRTRKPRNQRARRLSIWRVSICSLNSLLLQVLPYLKIKNRQAELMIILANYEFPSKLQDGFQTEAFNTFRQLNHRGSELAVTSN